MPGRRFILLAVLGIADDAYDFKNRAVIAQPEFAAQRRLAGPAAFGQLLIDDGDEDGSCLIRVVEITSAQQRDFQGREKFRRDDEAACLQNLRLFFELHTDVWFADAERYALG